MRGRPFAQEIVDSRGPAVLDRAQMIRTLLPYLMRSKETTLKLGPLPMGTITELAQSSARVLSKVASGEISIVDGGKLLEMLVECRKIL